MQNVSNIKLYLFAELLNIINLVKMNKRINNKIN